MIHSMTGYGRGEASEGDRSITVELRAVNHRFLDVQAKLPRALLALEREALARLRDRLARGRLEVFVQRGGAASEGAVSVDVALARRLLSEAAPLLVPTPGGPTVAGDVSLGALLALPGVLSVQEPGADVDAEGPLLLRALDAALDGLLAMRRTEGAVLDADLRARLGEIGGLADAIEALATRQPALFRERVERRARELLGDAVDPALLAHEVALLATRADVAEEITRLRAHVEHGLSLLAGDGPVGRALDFLVQELAREANTVGSKADDTRLTALVLALKGEIEKLREQVANVE